MTTAGPLPAHPPPAEGSVAGARRPTIRLLGHEPEPGAPRLTLVPAPPTRLPPPPELPAVDERLRRHVAGVLRLVLEVVDGRRPATQLSGHLAPRAQRYLAAARARPDLRAPTGRRRPATAPARGARLNSLRIAHPVDGVAEAAAVCGFAERVRALAARFERRDGRWWCVELRLG